jgi:hypothetical protein
MEQVVGHAGNSSKTRARGKTSSRSEVDVKLMSRKAVFEPVTKAMCVSAKIDVHSLNRTQDYTLTFGQSEHAKTQGRPCKGVLCCLKLQNTLGMPHVDQQQRPRKMFKGYMQG